MKPKGDDDAEQRSAFLKRIFEMDLGKFLWELTPEDLGHHSKDTENEVQEVERPPSAASFQWLKLAIEATAGSRGDEGTPIEFDLKFINASEEPHEFPVNMWHWKNNHPCHLQFLTTDGDEIQSTGWGHAVMAEDNRTRAPLPPGDSISVSFTSNFTFARMLEFGIGAYDFSRYDSVNYLYHYGGVKSDINTLKLPTA